MCLEQNRQILEEMRGLRRATEAIAKALRKETTWTPAKITAPRVMRLPQFQGRPVDLDDVAREPDWEPGVYGPSEHDMRDSGLPTGEPPEDSFLDDGELGYLIAQDESW